jgi:DNA-binding MarR family transcriptional regulator
VNPAVTSQPAARPTQRRKATLLASPGMTSREPLPFDPILRAAALWDERIGPSRTMAAVTSVMRVQQILLSAVDGALRPHGLTFARYEALVLLSFSRHGRLPMRVMGERLQLHPTSVTNIVDRLQADGLVRRVPHPTDRRATLVEMTDSGRAVLDDATEAVTEIGFGLSGLTAQEEVELTSLLSRVRLAAGDFAAEHADADAVDDRTELVDDPVDDVAVR